MKNKLLANNPLNKLKFASNYFGQKVFRYYTTIEDGQTFPLTFFDDGKLGALHNGYLELTPLQYIKPKHAKVVARLAFGNTKFGGDVELTSTADNTFGFSFKIINSEGYRLEYFLDLQGFHNVSLICLDRATKKSEYAVNHLKMIDYLRSKGYALPWNGLTINDLILYKWVKLKTLKKKSTLQANGNTQ